MNNRWLCWIGSERCVVRESWTVGARSNWRHIRSHHNPTFPSCAHSRSHFWRTSCFSRHIHHIHSHQLDRSLHFRPNRSHLSIPSINLFSLSLSFLISLPFLHPPASFASSLPYCFSIPHFQAILSMDSASHPLLKFFI